VSKREAYLSNRSALPVLTGSKIAATGSPLDKSIRIVATVASHQPAGYFDSYKKAFAALGRQDLEELYIEDRSETADADRLAPLEAAGGVFFSGGDQLRISSQIGDTPFESHVRRIYKSGGVIAGTSAGASVMAEIMLVRGKSAESVSATFISRPDWR
jgi:cyanophycinase